MTYYISYQDGVDDNKVKAIAESIKVNGWVGAPMVVWGDFIITGNHRYAACQMVDYEPETITLEEVFEEDGLDFGAAHAAADFCTPDWALDQLLMQLSDEIVEKYGIQW